MTPEPFVSAQKAADFLDINRRYLLECAEELPALIRPTSKRSARSGDSASPKSLPFLRKQ